MAEPWPCGLSWATWAISSLAVGPDQTHSLPGMHLETDVLEEHLATATKADVVEV
jgi:hypothetical protein